MLNQQKCKVSAAWMLGVMIWMLIILPAPAAEFSKTKIAVLDFQLQGQESDLKDMDKIAAEWLITGLVNTGRFDVVERRLLEKILAEHKLGMTGILDESSVAKVGKVLGVKAIVSGTISNLGGTIYINARLISVDTASIIAAETASASSASRMNDLVSQITEKIAQAFPLEGYVVRRAGKNVTIDLGKKAGVKPGMKFTVYKEGEVLKRPNTNEVLKIEMIVIGKIEIKTVDDNTSTGVILEEDAPNAVVYGSMLKSEDKEAPDAGKGKTTPPKQPETTITM